MFSVHADEGHVYEHKCLCYFHSPVVSHFLCIVSQEYWKGYVFGWESKISLHSGSVSSSKLIGEEENQLCFQRLACLRQDVRPETCETKMLHELCIPLFTWDSFHCISYNSSINRCTKTHRSGLPWEGHSFGVLRGAGFEYPNIPLAAIWLWVRD